MKLTVLSFALMLLVGPPMARSSTGNTAAQILSTIVAQLSSEQWRHQLDAAEALIKLNSRAALSLAEFLVIKDSGSWAYPGDLENRAEEILQTLQYTTTEYLVYNYGELSSVPGFHDSFRRVYLYAKSPFYRRRMFESLQHCADIRCLELFELAMTSRDSLTRGSAYKMLHNFDLRIPRVRSAIENGLQSVHHGEKLSAAYALLGRKDAGVIPLAQLALRSLFVLTRIYGIEALLQIEDPSVAHIYREGLKDADPMVRYFTILSLGRRSDVWSDRLLEEVRVSSRDLIPRTILQQSTRVPLKERAAEALRIAKDRFDWMHSYLEGSFTQKMTELFTTELRKPMKFILQWQSEDRSEADLAAYVLKSRSTLTPPEFGNQNQNQNRHFKYPNLTNGLTDNSACSALFFTNR